MSFLSDAWHTITAPIRLAGDVVEDVPGFDVMSEAVQDFARTPIGKGVFRALSSSLFGPLAAVVGPQLATIAWAVPGLLAGDDFDRAWITEFQWRAQKTAETLGGDAAGAIVKEISPALFEQMKAAMPDLSTPLWKLARDYAIREETAYMAQKLLHKAELVALDVYDYLDPIPLFDPETGVRINGPAPPPGASAFRAGEIETSAYISVLNRPTSLFAQGRERTAVEGRAASSPSSPSPAPVPIAASGAAAAAPPKNHDTMLAIVVLAAAGALAYWQLKGTKR